MTGRDTSLRPGSVSAAPPRTVNGLDSAITAAPPWSVTCLWHNPGDGAPGKRPGINSVSGFSALADHFLNFGQELCLRLQGVDRHLDVRSENLLLDRRLFHFQHELE